MAEDQRRPKVWGAAAGLAAASRSAIAAISAGKAAGCTRGAMTPVGGFGPDPHPAPTLTAPPGAIRGPVVTVNPPRGDSPGP